jgi:uncharacterized protein YegL
MPKRPGGALATRPLHFILICDCSGSMSLDGKIQSLNNAIHEALPHIRNVADENPNASIFVRPLRFSSGAQWVKPEPTPLDHFQWVDLIADSVPQTADFAAEFSCRLKREGAKSGDVQVSLLWNNYNDLDLHVICPHDELICFSSKKSRCGGVLDVDMNVSPESEAPVENIYWRSGGQPIGHYKVYVDHYRNHYKPGCDDPTHFKVAIRIGGSVEEFSGSISYGDEKKLVHEFDVSESISIGAGAGNTDMGVALCMVADDLKIPPMTDRALPPVLVLISDGQPTDDFEAGLKSLMSQPWGKLAVRIAIAIGRDADIDVLQRFIGNPEIKPLQANNPDSLVKYIRWVSTYVLKSASSPSTLLRNKEVSKGNSPTPIPFDEESLPPNDIW